MRLRAEAGMYLQQGVSYAARVFEARQSVNTMRIDSFMALTRCSCCDMLPAKQKVEVFLLWALAADKLSLQLTRGPRLHSQAAGN